MRFEEGVTGDMSTNAPGRHANMYAGSCVGLTSKCSRRPFENGVGLRVTPRCMCT
jgi:hypothetical protein